MILRSWPAYRFVEGLALAHLPLDGSQATQLVALLDQQLTHPSDAVCS
jgi:hypothetical protein